MTCSNSTEELLCNFRIKNLKVNSNSVQQKYLGLYFGQTWVWHWLKWNWHPSTGTTCAVQSRKVSEKTNNISLFLIIWIQHSFFFFLITRKIVGLIGISHPRLLSLCFAELHFYIQATQHLHLETIKYLLSWTIQHFSLVLLTISTLKLSAPSHLFPSSTMQHLPLDFSSPPTSKLHGILASFPWNSPYLTIWTIPCLPFSLCFPGNNLPIHFTVPATVALNCENVMPRTGLFVTVTTCSLGVNAKPAETSCNVITGWNIQRYKAISHM